LLRIFADERNNAVVQHLGKDEGLSSDIALALFEDSNGNIWVGTENSLVRITAVKGISVDGISAAHQASSTSDGAVWVGATDGLYRIADGLRRRYSETDGLPSSRVTGLASGPQTQLWVATDRGIARIDGDGVRPVQFPSGLRATGVTALTVDHDGALWFCDSEAGVFRWLHGDLHSFRGEAAVDRRRCPSAATDREGRVWFGFSDATLAVFHHGSFRQFSDKNGLTGGIVTAIYQDHEGTIWVGTNKGLSRLDADHFVSFTQQNGMPAKAIAGIVDDDLGYLWFSTITGIVRIDRSEFERAAKDPHYRIRYTLFDTADGLTGPPLYLGFPNATRSTDGRLWFVTTAGVAVIDPRQVRRAPQRAFPRIESLSANGLPVEPAANVTLPANISELFINYTALNFTSAAKTRFRYRLDGFDKDWVDAGSRREAIYTHIPPGQYTFRLEAGIDGSWDENSAALALSVAPTFYQTPWFYGGTAIVVLLCIVAAWKRRFARATREFAMVYEERARMAREIHDTLLQSLLGVALQFDVIAQTLEASPPAARDHLLRARDEVETYIREARQSIWDLRSPAVQAQGLAAALKATCDKVVVSSAVQCDFAVTGTTRRFPLRTEEQLLRIGQEAVTNAIRHASPRRIQVTLDYDERSVHLRVTDDGRGFDPTASPAENEGHWGLADMRERAKRIGAKFTLSTVPGQGTRIETTLPFKLAS
jgi:signal transduction histidine kinase/streptogramin lyase